MKTMFKKNGKRVLSAALCLLMAVMSLPLSAFAWTSEEGRSCTSSFGDYYVGSDGEYYRSQATMHTLVYNDDGSTYVKSYSSGNAKRKYLITDNSGTHQVYCVESGIDFNTGNTYTSKSGQNSSYFKNLPTDAQFGVMMALMYGWHEGKSSPVAGTNADDYAYATQSIIWEYHPNWDVVAKYIDEGITGTQAKKRPDFLRMIEDAKQGKFDLIVTREVCRFARNVVDTLVVTRELKSIGVEVFFIEDNIWTMDGDGELRLSLMATLAQEESRKTSERVKAGQKISRDNGVLYGNGNILGYDRVGDTYVINEEQAETVRMIYDLYLQGYGSMKIAGILTERKRKTASGLVKWSVSNIMRAIRNATYTGTKCYNKSRSNNFLEQKRINNLDMSTYEYVEGDFPAIISQEIWDKAQEIRESRVKPSLVSATKTTHSKRDSADVWVNKLRCSCGSSFRKNKWHTKLDGKTSYGYQCYNQLNNGNKKKREELGLDTDGYCDTRMITDWKLDFMAKALLEHLWTERRKSVLIAIDLIKYYYKEERENGKQSDAVVVQARLDKANTRLTNLIAMRADGEITKDEYQVMRTPIDTEIQELQKALENIPTESDNSKGFDLDGIISTLNSLVDFSGNTISHDVINQFVYMVTPTSDTTFEWYVNLNGKPNVKATFTAEGRKKNCLIRLEEIERISSLHRKENESNAQFIKNPCLLTYLHRQLSRKRRTKI